MTRPTPADVLERAARSCSPISFSTARMETPDWAHELLTRAGFTAGENGWRDPDAGEVVGWQEGVRRARRRVR